jgi:hypothetical protein
MLRALRLIFKSLVLFWAIGRWAFGYIDPNTGGMLFQVLAILLAFSSAIILFFSRNIRMGIARLLRNFRSKSDE